MRRLLSLFAAAATLAALAPPPRAIVPAATAAPVPKHLTPPAPRYYFPTAVGATWVYDVGGRQEAFVVTKVENEKGVKMVSVAAVAGGADATPVTMSVSAAGLNKMGREGLPFDEPSLLVRTPVEPGDHWSAHYKPSESRRKVIGVEQVRVPAGTFTAVRISRADRPLPVACAYPADSGRADARPRGPHEEWYALGVGLVKESYGDGREKVLKSFSPGQCK